MKHKNLKVTLFALFLFTIAFSNQAFAQSNQFEGIEPGNIQPDKYYKAEVLKVTNQREREVQGQVDYSQIVQVKLLDGEDQGKIIDVKDEGLAGLNNAHKLKPGDKVVVIAISSGETLEYYIADKYRFPVLVWIVIIFIALGIIFGRLKGLTSLFGLCVSITILALFVVPKILAGANPLLITLIASCAITGISIFLAHGFSKRTGIALASTLITLFISAGLALLFVHVAKLFGLGSEDAFYLQAFPEAKINLQGLLLGGIIIGALGILDDVTTTQTAAVDEIKKANPKLSRSELYHRAMSIGREHIAALINTLALAYAGASLPLFLLFVLNKNQPLWVIINGELVAEELVRTLVGSVALILAVPISTFLATVFLSRSKVEEA